MKAKQFYNKLKKYDPEWIRAFVELAKLYKEASPEHRSMALDVLRKCSGT